MTDKAMCICSLSSLLDLFFRCIVVSVPNVSIYGVTEKNSILKNDCNIGTKLLLGNITNINAIKVVNLDKCMTLDSTAVRNLELVRNNSENKKYGSLLWVLDKTKTGMGARLLTKMVLSPLKDLKEIAYRQDGV